MSIEPKESLFQQTILDLTREPQTPEQLARQMAKRGIRISHRDLTQALSALVDSGQLMRAKSNRYAHPGHFNCLLGTFCGTGRNFSFVTPDGGGEDYFIPPHRDGGAWNGDRVMIHLLDRPSFKRGHSAEQSGRKEAEVFRVLSECRDELTGCLVLRGKTMLFRADNGKYPDIVISKKNLDYAHPGDRVSVRIIFRGSDKYLPQGAVIKVFGAGVTMDSAIASILHENDVPDSFPPEVAAEAEKLPTAVSEQDRAGRLDLRSTKLFTIDGDTAKDFDDAVSLETLPNGHYRLGVHIADVSYYVRPGSALDEEAFRRGMSVYYPGHVVPMLPFPLSNGICSLNPGVNRLAFSTFVEIGADGKHYTVEFHRSVICSHARLTYREVNAILSGDEASRSARHDLVPILEQMNDLAHILHEQRVTRGALELNIPECEILCDERGNVTGVEKRTRGEGERLIEEFMLVTNEAVAVHLHRCNMQTVYRVHESPDPQKLRQFARQARLFGYRLRESELTDTHALQAVLDQAEGKEYQQALPSMLLRAMARARYSPDNLGHYGLAAQFYLHFTSPIRRYPDLVVHRMLTKQLAGQQSSSEDREFCSQAALQASEREIASDTAERDIDKLYQAEYMSQFIGHDFSGYVSGVTNFGIFVCLDNLIEGLVRLDTIENEWFEYDPEHMTLTGKHNGKRYYLGLPVRITVVNASSTTGQIDFIFPPDEGTVG